MMKCSNIIVRTQEVVRNNNFPHNADNRRVEHVDNLDVVLVAGEPTFQHNSLVTIPH